MNVWQAIATGFDGGIVRLGPRGLGVGLYGELSEAERTWRSDRVWEVLRRLGPHTWNGTDLGARAELEEESAQEFGQRPFATLPVGAQSMLLLILAHTGRPPRVLLAEALSC